MEVSTSIHHFLFFIKNFAHDSILFTLPHPTLPRFNLLHILLMTVSYLHLSPKDNLSLLKILVCAAFQWSVVNLLVATLRKLTLTTAVRNFP